MQVSNLSVPAFPDPRLDCERTTKTHDVCCRDPFVMLAGDVYYLYRSRGGKIECLTSLDLEFWSDPIVVFDPPADFYGCDQFFWAPECHFYGGNFTSLRPVNPAKRARGAFPYTALPTRSDLLPKSRKAA